MHCFCQLSLLPSCMPMCLCVVFVQRYSSIDEEDMVQATQSDISTLCGQNLLLWMQYLELVTFNKIITHHLAKEHHLQRVDTYGPSNCQASYSWVLIRLGQS